MTESEDDAKFETTVAVHLSEGLHTRRGLTPEQYTALCRKVWDECRTSPGFPFKVLIDPLRPIESMLANSTQEYIHWRVADELAAQKEPSTEIRCSAVGAVKPDLSTGPDERPSPSTGEPETPETRRYMLAVFDVLGFSALLHERGLAEVTALYSRLIAEAVTKEGMRSYSIVRFSKTQMGSVLGTAPIGHAHFSDTILLWVPLVQHFIGPFMARCGDMMCEALRMGLALRGAISVGPAVMHSRTGTFVGPPVVEAARLEQAQNWLGVSLAPSTLAADVSREFDPHLVIPYRIPFKKGKADNLADLALDWPARFRARYGVSPVEAIRAIDRSPSHRIYYDNAVKFAEFSAGPVFRSEGFHRPNLGELASAAIRARQQRVPLGHRHQLMLKDIARTDPVGELITKFVQQVAAGDDPPAIPKGLPRNLQRFLKELSLATKGSAKFVQLVPCVVEVVLKRLTGTALSSEANAVLTELQGLGEDGINVSRFLREFADGGNPVVPRKLSNGMAPLLKGALAWTSEGKVPRGLLEHLAQDCMRARLDDEPLEANALRVVAALEATGGNWQHVSSFFREIAAGKDPAVPAGFPEPTRSNLTRVSLASRLAGVQQPRTLEIVSVGFGDPATGVDLFSLVDALVELKGHVTEMPDKAEQAIRKFEEAASERATIAQQLRALITDAPPVPVDDSLPIALRIVLTQIHAVARDEPIPIAPSLVGLAAIRSRHGGGPMGDCIRFSLHALARSTKEAEELANYLWRLANGGPAGPAPLLTDPQLAETAEEARCLADKEVGGIRLMMTQARRETPGAETNSPEAT